MQEMHSIGSGSRLFNAGGDDRRSRPEDDQALKCPRCDSLNTKFCYYNNYNLSQPRHFCKACRRYWTKGGVLRNVPVGGGCRKTSKRSKPKQTTTTAAPTATATTTNTIPPSEPPQREQKSPTSHSSSESSSLTAANTTAGGNNALEVGSNESKAYGSSSINSNFQGGPVEQGSAGGIFSEIGIFSSFTNSRNDQLGFGFSAEMKLPMTGGFTDQTVDVELSVLQSSRSGNGGGFGALDWGGTGGGFDLPNTVDHNYWNQSQWIDQYQNSLYLP